MRRTKTEMVYEILVIVKKIDDHCEELKLPQGHLHIHEDCLQLTQEEIAEAYIWIQGIQAGALRTLEKAIALLTPDQWRRYALWGDDFDEHQEVKIRHRAGVELRKLLIVKTRPGFFKKGYVDERVGKDKGTEGTGSRSRSHEAGVPEVYADIDG